MSRMVIKQAPSVTSPLELCSEERVRVAKEQEKVKKHEAEAAKKKRGAAATVGKGKKDDCEVPMSGEKSKGTQKSKGSDKTKYAQKSKDKNN